MLGALYLLALVGWAARSSGNDDQQLGNQAQAVLAFVEARFGNELGRIGAAIGAVAVLCGAIIGAVAGQLVDARDALEGRKERSAWSRGLLSLAVTAALHSVAELYGMAQSPQLYADSFYARGGLRRTIEVLATDVLGTTGVALLGLLALAAFLAGSPPNWLKLPERIAAIASRIAETPTRALAVASCAFAIVLGASVVERTPTASRTDPNDKRPNVIIIAADSLRADRVNKTVAPHLAELAEKGVRFDRAYVSLPRTFSSWVTILTGRHAHHHGVRSMFPRWEDRAKSFDALPSRLAQAGYATSVVSDYAGDIFGRIDLGFERVETPTFNFRQLVRQRALERMTPLLPFLHGRAGRALFPVLRELNDAADPHLLAGDAIRTLRKSSNKPFFMTVFFSTAHFPYAAPAPFYARFADPAYRGRYKYHKPVGLGTEAAPDTRDVQQVRALYDGAVASIDDAVAQLLDELEKSGLAENTILVITADHGEMLYEHEHGQGHGDHLFGDEVTHVPLIIIDPRRKTPRHEAAMVRDVDLAPTLYALTGVAPPQDLDGRSLVPLLDGGKLQPALAFAETELWFTETIPGLAPELRLPYPGIARLTEIDTRHGDEVVIQRSMVPLTTVARHRMVRDERFKLIYVPTRMGAKYMLFDTERDPGETRDVAREHPDVVAKLKGELWGFMLRDPLMTERAGLLVPRDMASIFEAHDEPDAMRLDEPAGPGTP